ncbi:hypothetical protein DSO57_1023209 [Entomophthora muscae]|uniref:Uncharacterized protein n=1 Tax=Entomophthora muscae TaxID=34485 RepID=A0ACC2SRT9_9FUNG|nr:hypothetical protein DSO57_1023209 [Entomophthora muscae]
MESKMCNNSSFGQGSNLICYDLIDECQQLLQQCYALMDSIMEWLSFLNTSEREASTDFNSTQEVKEGLLRLGISCKKEAQFLEGLLQNEEQIQSHHIRGSNLPYLEAVYRCARQETGLVSIFKSVRYSVPIENTADGQDAKRSKVEKYRIDVISCHGAKWIKVSARNARWLLCQNSMVDSVIPEDSMESDPIPLELKANVMLLVASQNQLHFRAPEVCFQFNCFGDRLQEKHRPMPIPTSLFRRLNEIGVSVAEIPSLAVDRGFNFGSWKYDPSQVATPELNLDITTLLALASQLTYHGRFSELLPHPPRNENDALKIQLQQEKQRPIMPLLAYYLAGRILTTTQTCYDKFLSIISTIAGPLEALRARILFRTHSNDSLLIQHDLDRRDDDPFKGWKLLVGTNSAPDVQVLPDSPSASFQSMIACNSLRSYTDIHIIAFGSGHQRKLTTVTANIGVARSISGASASCVYPIDFPDGDYFLVHEPRSLAENKLVAN